jgi:hypothetical protein
MFVVIDGVVIGYCKKKSRTLQYANPTVLGLGPHQNEAFFS